MYTESNTYLVRTEVVKEMDIKINGLLGCNMIKFDG